MFRPFWQKSASTLFPAGCAFSKKRNWADAEGMNVDDAKRNETLPGNMEAKSASDRRPIFTETSNTSAPRLDDGLSSEYLCAPPLRHWRDQADGFFSE
jgi:hypothetical protein